MKFRALTYALCLAATPALSDVAENALALQSVQAWEKAQQAENPVDRLSALQSAQAAIEMILQEHAGSNLAVSIVLGQANLPFTRAELRDAIAAVPPEIKPYEQTREVNAVIVKAVRQLEEAAALSPTDRDTALSAYLMMREADSALTHAPIRFPRAKNLGLLEEADIFKQRADQIAKAVARVAELCDGHAPQSCLLFESERIADGIRDNQFRAGALRDIAGAWAHAGQFAEAERIAAGINDDSSRAGALSDIAGAWAQAGQMTEASRLWSEAELIAAGIKDYSSRNEALSDIAGAWAHAGQFAEAERIAAGIKNYSSRARALSNIAGAWAHAGQMTEASRFWSEAERVAAGIGNDAIRALTLYNIVASRAKAGQFAEAKRVAAGIEHAEFRAEALGGMVDALAKSGRFAEAGRIAAGIENDAARAGALSDIASRL